MRNKIFQFLWYYVVRPFVPVISKDKEKNPVLRHALEIYVQVRLAQLIGEIAGFLAGDSNSAVFSTFMVMQRFSGMVLAIGQGGAVASDWTVFFRTKRGQYVYNAMTANGVIVVWNIGGNYLLMGITFMAEVGINNLWRIFPRAWFCTIPPLYYALLAKVSKLAGVTERDEAYYREGVPYINSIITTAAKPKVIDLYRVFAMPDGTPVLGALKDMVHFRRVSVDFIRQLLGGLI